MPYDMTQLYDNKDDPLHMTHQGGSKDQWVLLIIEKMRNYSQDSKNNHSNFILFHWSNDLYIMRIRPNKTLTLHELPKETWTFGLTKKHQTFIDFRIN